MFVDKSSEIADFISKISKSERAKWLAMTARAAPVEEAEDALHDAIVQALSGSSSFRSEAQVRSWLFRIVFNAALMRRRKVQRARVNSQPAKLRKSGGAWAMETTSDPGCSPTPEDALAAKTITTVLETLEPTYQQVVQRCLFEGEAPAVVADDLGISRAGLRTRLTRARRMIEEGLERAGFAHVRDRGPREEVSETRDAALLAA